MINPATQSQDQLNEFTQKVNMMGRFHWGGYWVRLRDGTLVRPVFMPAEDDTCEDCFGVDRYRWNLDGTSVTSSNFDMMETVRDV